MRTTLTLDPDVAKALKRLVKETDRPFKQVVNDTIRAGLAGPVRSRARRYRLEPQSLGAARTGLSLDKALELAARIEDEEAVRKLELRK